MRSTIVDARGGTYDPRYHAVLRLNNTESVTWTPTGIPISDSVCAITLYTVGDGHVEYTVHSNAVENGKFSGIASGTFDGNGPITIPIDVPEPTEFANVSVNLNVFHDNRLITGMDVWTVR
jgi:hypothetical protein